MYSFFPYSSRLIPKGRRYAAPTLEGRGDNRQRVENPAGGRSRGVIAFTQFSLEVLGRMEDKSEKAISPYRDKFHPQPGRAMNDVAQIIDALSHLLFSVAACAAAWVAFNNRRTLKIMQVELDSNPRNSAIETVKALNGGLNSVIQRRDPDDNITPSK